MRVPRQDRGRLTLYQSREQIRQVYLDVWHKLASGAVLEPMEALIAEIIELHPEYHALLERGDDIMALEYTPETGQTNPFLHMGMHIALREQVGGDRPAGVSAIYTRLAARHGQHEAEHAMIECLGRVMWQAQRDQSEPDESAYIECLKKL
ncbi:MAG: DUF1841 family protein [Gammaproteobacteria bacterium]|nr:DUF1841 family protein [Gammaproteobacteria bacterium]